MEYNNDFLLGVIDSSPHIVQVFKSLRDENGQIIDFVRVLNNSKAIEEKEEVLGSRALEKNPGMIASGIVDRMKDVVETGIPSSHEIHHFHEQFDGWSRWINHY